MVFSNSRKLRAWGCLTTEEVSEFESVYKEIVQDAVELNDSESRSMDLMRDWMVETLEYNVQRDGNFRRYLVPMAYKRLVQNPTKEDMRLAFMLGWILEIYHAASFIADDLIDNNGTRSGKPTWGKLDKVGVLAVNDTLMLRLTFLKLLRKYFGKQSYYPALYRCARDSLEKLILGRLMSDQCRKRGTGEKNVESSLLMERYSKIISFKTTQSIISLPINLAMIMAGLARDPEIVKNFNDILLEIGHYIQVKEDFGTVFETSCGFHKESHQGTLMELIRTDYDKKEWSWLLIHAASRCDSKEFEKIKTFLVHPQNGHVNLRILRQKLKQMGIIEMYNAYQKELYESFARKVENLAEGDEKRFLMDLLT